MDRLIKARVAARIDQFQFADETMCQKGKCPEIDRCDESASARNKLVECRIARQKRVVCILVAGNGYILRSTTIITHTIQIVPDEAANLRET
jgi:hypothetical protein